MCTYILSNFHLYHLRYSKEKLVEVYCPWCVTLLPLPGCNKTNSGERGGREEVMPLYVSRNQLKRHTSSFANLTVEEYIFSCCNCNISYAYNNTHTRSMTQYSTTTPVMFLNFRLEAMSPLNRHGVSVKCRLQTDRPMLG